MGLYWAGGSIVLGWRFRCTGMEVPLYRAGGSVVLGTGGSIVLCWRFRCTGLYWVGGSIVWDCTGMEIPLYWAGGSGWRFCCTGLEVPLYWAVLGRSSIVLGTGGSIVLGRRFHCMGLYWAGGSIVLARRFCCTGLEVPLYCAGGFHCTGQ